MLSTGMNMDGYNCAFCGYFVMYGTYHQCITYKTPEPGSTNPSSIITYPDPTLIEIRDLLKQLIELMEKQS